MHCRLVLWADATHQTSKEPARQAAQWKIFIARLPLLITAWRGDALPAGLSRLALDGRCPAHPVAANIVESNTGRFPALGAAIAFFSSAAKAYQLYGLCKPLRMASLRTLRLARSRANLRALSAWRQPR